MCTLSLLCHIDAILSMLVAVKLHYINYDNPAISNWYCTNLWSCELCDKTTVNPLLEDAADIPFIKAIVKLWRVYYDSVYSIELFKASVQIQQKPISIVIFVLFLYNLLQ